MSSSKTNSHTHKHAAELHTFKVEMGANPARKRVKFGPDRRQEVKAVRRKRGCLRCSMLRIRCSHDDICISCQRLALVLHAHERNTMSFSACIRTRASEASIFEILIPASVELRNALTTQSTQLAVTTITLGFSSLITWDLESLVGDVVDWLNDATLSGTSKVGTLSSPRFLNLIQPFVDEDTRMQFQRMVYAVSLAYTQPGTPDKHQITIPELIQVGSMAGHNFLKSLDRQLKPEQLRNCSRDELRALFLLIFGTILAAGYAEPKALDRASETLARFMDTQSFLCQILAHYLVYLGSHLNLQITCGAEQFILKAAPARWNRQGLFQWRMASDVGSKPHMSSNNEQNIGLGDLNSHDWPEDTVIRTRSTESGYKGSTRGTCSQSQNENDLLQAEDPAYGHNWPSDRVDEAEDPVAVNDGGIGKCMKEIQEYDWRPDRGSDSMENAESAPTLHMDEKPGMASKSFRDQNTLCIHPSIHDISGNVLSVSPPAYPRNIRNKIPSFNSGLEHTLTKNVGVINGGQEVGETSQVIFMAVPPPRISIFDSTLLTCQKCNYCVNANKGRSSCQHCSNSGVLIYRGREELCSTSPGTHPPGSSEHLLV